MSIRIELDDSNGLKLGHGTRVFDSESGTEIHDVSWLEISIRANEFVVARMEVMVDELVGADHLLAEIDPVPLLLRKSCPCYVPDCQEPAEPWAHVGRFGAVCCRRHFEAACRIAEREAA